MVKESFYKGMYVVQHELYVNRPTLVFLHDSLGCVQLWRDYPNQLAQATHCNLLIYDRVGYGKAEAMETYVRPVNYMELEAHVLVDLLDHYQVNQPILFGHSDGGTIALLAASLYPDRIHQLIVEAAHIFVEALTLKGVYEAMENYKHTTLKERLEKYHGDKTATLFNAWTLTWTRADYKDWNIENDLKQIKAPLLFVQGEKDEFGTMAQVVATVNKPKGIAEMFILKDVGHSPHKEMPESVVERVSEFINQHV